MSKKFDLLGIVSGVDQKTNKITLNLVNYIDSGNKSWVVLRDTFSHSGDVKLPYRLYKNGSADADGHIGEFWAIVPRRNTRKESILKYSRSMVGQAVVISVTPKKYVFNNKKGELKSGYSLIFGSMISYDDHF